MVLIDTQKFYFDKNNCFLLQIMRISLIGFLVLYPFLSFADHPSPSFETGSSGAILTTPGSTLPKGKVTLGIGFQYIDLNELSNQRLEDLGALDEHVHSVNSLLNATANFAYGFTNDLTVGLSLPYVKRTDVRESHHHTGTGEAEFSGDSSGIGDLNLYAQYRFFNSNTADSAIIFGIKTPTGDTDEQKLDGALFEAEQQPGSGSWDPFLGLSFNKNWGDFGLAANILYTLVNEGTKDTDLGNLFNYNLATTYRTFSPNKGHDHHDHDSHSSIIDYVDFVLELNGDHKEKAEISGLKDKHTGGHTLYISPGVRIGLGHRWSFFTSFGIPIIDDLNGVQSESDYRLIGGISTTF